MLDGDTARTVERVAGLGPVLRAHGNGPQSVPAVQHTVRATRRAVMMSGLHLWHRASQAGSVRQMDRRPRPAAAVQQSHMPGACQELGSITWPHTARVSA